MQDPEAKTAGTTEQAAQAGQETAGTQQQGSQKRRPRRPETRPNPQPSQAEWRHRQSRRGQESSPPQKAGESRQTELKYRGGSDQCGGPKEGSLLSCQSARQECTGAPCHRACAVAPWEHEGTRHSPRREDGECARRAGPESATTAPTGKPRSCGWEASCEHKQSSGSQEAKTQRAQKHPCG